MRIEFPVPERVSWRGLTPGLLMIGMILQPGGTAAQKPDQKSPVVVNKAGVSCHTEYVRMRDGVLLATDVYLPPAPGRHPVILQRTPYGLRLGHGCFERTSGQMAYWAEHGYVGVNQDARGTFRSQGTFQPIVQEQADGYDAVEWAAAQPWSNGRVGMSGASYFGVTQWQAALASPPHLLAIAPAQTATDYHDHWTYVNGVFDLWFGQSWLLNFFAPDELRRREIAKGQTAEQALKTSDEYLARSKGEIFSQWSSQVPLTGFDGYRTLAPYYYEWLAHPNYDAYWAKVDVEAHWGDVKVPAFISGGWSDLFALGSVRGFLGLRAHGGSPEARTGTMLIMQPGGHGGEGMIEYGPGSHPDLRSQQLRFYDRYVKGGGSEPSRDPAVQLFVQVPPDNGPKGHGFWVSSDTFPLPATQAVRFNLRSGGKANSRRGDGVLDGDRPSDGPPDTFVYDPKAPVPSYGGGLCCTTLGAYFGSGAQDQSVIELRDDVLVYTSPPLTKDLAAVGAVRVTFWAQTTARDTDFTAKLVDLHPGGFAHAVLDRVVRARFREGSKKPPSLIEPGKAYQYTIDLGYAGSVFKRGHRIRLDLSSSNFPHLARNHNTGDDPSTDSRFVTATQTILHTQQQPSFLELSVVPDIKVATGE